ncbi:hypothetical protein C0J52_21643 [Blattella germanica]|nr:hypothetical protein C0J52_21643 [Blattella germanica]
MAELQDDLFMENQDGEADIPLQNLHRSESMVSLCYRSLVNFITDNNFVGLQNFLENKRVQVDDRDENNTTALIFAANKGKIQFVRELINHGADVNAEDGDNWSALLCAAKEGYRDICLELLEHGADIEHRDMGGWTALMWATYKGHTAAATLLLERGAEVNAHGNYHISSLLWGAGRGHVDIYGTTALVWACRKGNVDIVDALLKAGANVDTAGMYSWTALLVATLGNHVDVVTRLLEHKPNVNALDKDGCTALTLACKEGFHEIAVALLNVGAYINIQDRAGDTNLIHAVKGGHRGVVEALLKKYADVDISGKDRKTAIYWAVEKGNVAMVKLLLSANPDLEISTKDGDTPLLRAVRIRNVEIVQLLLDKKAKVSASDKKGDTALHIAMRARSKGIVEVLLRNPKNSQLLYRPNRSGETPYNIDMNHQKTILGQIFGARRLNTNEDNENMLGYDLYSSALADILSEPSLSMPITVGLYAKWGSGKSFLLNKLREEMKNFARQWVDPVFQFSTLLLLVVVHIALLVGMTIGLAVQSWLIGVCSGGGLVLLCYIFLLLVWYGSQRYDWYWPYNFHVYVTRKLNSLKLILQVIFYFTDQTRVSSTTGGENSVVQMLGSLYDSIENNYGAFPTRLYRAFRPKNIIIEATTAQVILITIGLVLCVAVVANLYTWSQMLQALFFSQRRHLQRAISHLDTLKSEGFLQALRSEVNLMTDMVKCLDSFTLQQTRLVVIVDGLDSCEQDKVLLVLDAVHMLFSDTTSPFIVILAIDPHVISKAVEVNSRRLFSESNIGGHDYLRNMVHLPFYLQNSGLRKVKVAQQTAQYHRKSATATTTAAWNENEESVSLAATTALSTVSGRRMSSESGLSSSEKLKPSSRKGSRKLKLSESIASSLGSNLNRVGGAHDLTKMLLTDDYFSDLDRDERKFDIFLTFHRNSLLVSDLKIFLPFTINLDPYIKKVIKEEQQSVDENGLHMGSQFATSPPAVPAMVANSPQSWVTPSTSSNPWSGHKPSVLRRQNIAKKFDHTGTQYDVSAELSSRSRLASSMDGNARSTWNLSVDGVCELLTKIDDVSTSFLPSYTSLIRDNNINGRVLLHCDLDELKKVLQMNFGDWELFRMLVVSLREQELTSFSHQEEMNPKNVRFAVPTNVAASQSQDRKGMSSKSSGQLEKEKSNRGDTRSANKQTIMEKQVTLEEQMICGALQTLNEEACEDVMEETEEEVEVPYKTGALVTSTELDRQRGGRIRTSSQSSSVVDTLGETEVLLLQSSPLSNPHWQPVTISIDSNMDCCPSAESSVNNTPIQQRKQRDQGKPPLPPTKLESTAGTNKGSLHNLLQRTGSSRSISSSHSIGSASVPSIAKSKQRQRPSSLLVLGDEISMDHMSPPSSPKHHVAFRSHSADDGRNVPKPPQSGSTSLLTSLTSSLRNKKSNSSLSDGGNNNSTVSPSFLMTPTSSLEKLNRLKDRIIRTVTAPSGSNSSIGGGAAVASDANVDMDSDDESTPLVSEISTPAANNSMNALTSEFLNRGFAVVGYSSHSGSSEDSPSSVKTTPVSPPQASLDHDAKEQRSVESENGNVDPLNNGPFGVEDNAAVSSSCGSSISLSQVLEPTSNYYHLVAVSDSISSVGSSADVGSQFSSREQLSDSDLKMSCNKTLHPSSGHLLRQDALDRSAPTSRRNSKDGHECKIRVWSKISTSGNQLQIRRRLGRPKNRWEDDIMHDLKMMKVKNWMNLVLNRREWRKFVERVKTFTGEL